MTLSLCDDLATLSIATSEPYSCTFQCGATFTNSLHWRQHEVSAHRQAEVWRCSLPPSSASATASATVRKSSSTSPSGTPACAEVFFMLHFFTAHLKTVHGIASTIAADSDSEDQDGGRVATGSEDEGVAYDTEQNHVYEGGQRNFWCGFCVGPVTLENRGVEAWAERLDHIEGHLGKGKRVEDDWVGLDGGES